MILLLQSPSVVAMVTLGMMGWYGNYGGCLIFAAGCYGYDAGCLHHGVVCYDAGCLHHGFGCYGVGCYGAGCAGYCNHGAAGGAGLHHVVDDHEHYLDHGAA